MKNWLYCKVVALLNFFAAKLLKKHNPKIIAITGSVGKTSTKRAVAAVVEQDYRTQWHKGNFNSEVGLPLALFEINVPKNLYNPFGWLIVLVKMMGMVVFWRYPYQLLVLELGIDKLGDMDRFLKYIHPDIGIVTAVQGAHLGAGLGNIDTVYLEKTKLAKAAKTALVNGDNSLLQTRLPKELPGVHLYGTNREFEYSGTITQQTDGRILVSMDSHNVQTNFIARYSGLMFIAALAVAKILNIDPTKATYALEELHPYEGRMNLLKGKKGSLIIDDSYNNVSVAAAKAAISTLVKFPGSKRKILVFGMMNEMGDYSKAGHEEIANYICKQNLDTVITIGDHPRQFMKPIFEKAKLNATHFTSPYDAGAYLAPLLKRGDVVLVKGSQNKVFAEEVTALLLNLESDRSKLVRQSAKWQKIKHQQFSE